MPDAEIKNGVFLSSRVTQNFISNIEKPGAFDWKKVKAIILHQTWTESAKKTFEVWKTRPYGAHFVVDRSGDTYQEAKALKSQPSGPKDWKYTGKTLTYSGTDGKIYQTATLNKKCNHAVSKDTKLYQFSNSNSVGIEIVSMYDPIAQTYPTITSSQTQSVIWLVSTILELMPKVSLDSIYAHGAVSAKDPTEAVTALAAVKTTLKKDETETK